MVKFQIYNAGLTQKNPVGEINLEQYVDLIKNDTTTKLVQEKYRTSEDVAERKFIKKNELRFVTPQVLVTERNESGVIERTGILMGDIDNVEDVGEALRILKIDKYTLIVHKSVSGNGIRIFVRIDVEKAEHLDFFNSYSNYLYTTYQLKLDQACKNLTRTSLLSHDEEVYLNDQAVILDETFVEEFNKKQSQLKTKETKSATTQSFDVVKKVISDNMLIQFYKERYIERVMDKLVNCEEGAKHDTLLKQSTLFGSLVFYGIIEYREAIEVLKDAIEQRSSTVVDMDSAISTLTHGVEYGFLNPIDLSNWIVFDENRFWDYTLSKDNTIGFILSYLKIQNVLKKLGVGIYKKGSTRIIIHKHNNIINEISKVDVIEILNQHVNTLPATIGFLIHKNSLKEKLLRSLNSIFTELMLYSIDRSDIQFQKSTKKNSYHYFQNKFVEVTKDEIVLRDYSQLKNSIWSSKIKERTIEECSCSFEELRKLSEFARLLHLVCEENEEKFIYICTLIGYLMHEYKNPSESRAVILMDKVNDFDSPNGRTGKGIILTALKYFLNQIGIDGKTFSFKSDFRYQDVNFDTQLVAFDDVAERFDFEKLFSVITEDFPVNKKNIGQFILDKSESPKIILSSNYPIL